MQIYSLICLHTFCD